MKGLLIFILSYVWKQSWRNKNRSGFIVLTYSLAILAIFTLYSFSRGVTEKIADSIIKQIGGQIVINHISENDLFPRSKLIEKLDSLGGEYKMIEKLKFNAIIRSEYNMRNVKIIGRRLLTKDGGSSAAMPASSMPEKIIEWDTALWKKGGLLISSDLQKSLKTEIGRRLVVSISGRYNLEVGLPVAGVYQSFIPAESLVDISVDLMPLQEILRIPGLINEASIWVPQSELSRTLAELDNPKNGFRAFSWEKRYPSAAAIITLIRLLAFLFSNVVFFALLFILVNNIIISLDERKKELFILSSIGFTNRVIVVLQLLEILFLLLVAIGLGLLFSFLLLGIYWKSGLNMSRFAEGLKTFYLGDAQLVPQMRIRDFLEIIFLLLIFNTLATVFTTGLKINK